MLRSQPGAREPHHLDRAANGQDEAERTLAIPRGVRIDVTAVRRAPSTSAAMTLLDDVSFTVSPVS